MNLIIIVYIFKLVTKFLIFKEIKIIRVIIYYFFILQVLFLSVLTALAAFACTTYDTVIMSGSKVEAKVSETWRALNCCRCYGAVLGWIIIIIMKPKDQLAQFLNSN